MLKMGQRMDQECSIFKNGPSEICGIHPLSRPYHFKVFKDCLPQISVDPILWPK